MKKIIWFVVGYLIAIALLHIIASREPDAVLCDGGMSG